MRSCLLVLGLILATSAAAQAGEAGKTAVQLLTERDYRALGAHLDKLRRGGREAGRWVTRLEAELEGMIEQTSEPKSLIRYANEWCRKKPRLAWPFLIRAELALAQAWQNRRQRGSRERGSGTDWLGFARKDLEYAARMRPSLAIVFSRQIGIMSVANDSSFAAMRAQRRAQKMDRGDVTAALALANFLLPEWNGSHREALDFAEEYVQDAPSKPAREYVLLWTHSQLADRTYFRDKRRKRKVERLAFRLDANFPNAWETHVAMARIQETVRAWKPFAKALRTAARLGHAPSMRRAADLAERGEQGFSKDPQTAYEWRSRLARKGDTAAMVSLGQQLAKGHGVAKDEKQALTWFQRAARDDAPAAHTALGVAYAEGSHGAERDLKLARRHLERARKLGQAEASFRLGQLHNRGVFGTRDAKFATELLVEAGERGYAAAWLYLGRCYEAVSARNAVYYYRLGLEAGDEEASQALLLLLRKRPEFREDDDPREVIDPTRR